jgi:phosphomannomutase
MTTFNQIKFGTDGWRAVIADKFTFENVRIIAQAVSDYINSQEIAHQGIGVSYDTRFMSAQFARLIAEVVSSNAISVFLSRTFTPTPVLSFTVKNRNLAGGVMVTASHNPYEYSGVKFKGSYGGSAMMDMTESIEKWLYRTPPRHDIDLIKKNIHEVDFFPDYAAHLRSYLRFNLIESFPDGIVYDPIHAAGSGFLDRFLHESNMRFHIIHRKCDPFFGNKLPEPILKNLIDLRKAVLSHGAQLGLATDGDADRFGVLDDQGNFVELHDLMPLLFSYLIESRGWTGDVVRTTSMTNTIDKMANELGRKVHEVPVGFKNVCEVMLQEDILIGGEESGGFGYKNHIPERDGILSCLLILEMLGAWQKPIRELVAEIRAKYGPFNYGRIDQYGAPEILNRNMELLRKSPPGKVGHFQVESVSLIDGIKFYFTNQSWMLLRVSQTEPLGRIYVGSDCDEKVQALLREGKTLLTELD